MKEKILLLGGGGHCHSCIDVIETEGKYEIAGIVDKSESRNKNVLGYPVIGTDNDLHELLKITKNILITIGQIKNFSLRMSKFHELKNLGYQFPIVISPRAYVSSHATLDEGTIVMHDALVVAGAKIGKNCIINSKALIEHDSSIGDFSHVSTAAVVNGNCQIGAKSFLGSNCVIREGVTLPIESVVPAGMFWKGKL